MDKVALASINTLRTSAEADFVPPSEQLITLTHGQLSELVTRAVEKAIQPLQDSISSLEDRIDHLEEENATMRLKLSSVESLEEQDVSRLACDIAYDRQRISRLEKVEPQPLQKDRGDILRALLAANGGKMLAKDARQKMHLPENRFSELLAGMDDDIAVKPLHSDKRKLVIILKSELLPRK
jgi:septal ring factor EnvC (AmiA/AmiB activator)